MSYFYYVFAICLTVLIPWHILSFYMINQTVAVGSSQLLYSRRITLQPNSFMCVCLIGSGRTKNEDMIRQM